MKGAFSLVILKTTIRAVSAWLALPVFARQLVRALVPVQALVLVQALVPAQALVLVWVLALAQEGMWWFLQS